MPSKHDDTISQLTAKGFTTGSIADRMFAYLRSKGGTGSLADMMRQKRPSGRVTWLFDPNEIP